MLSKSRWVALAAVLAVAMTHDNGAYDKSRFRSLNVQCPTCGRSKMEHLQRCPVEASERIEYLRLFRPWEFNAR